MNEQIAFLQDSVSEIEGRGISQGYLSSKDKKELKILDELAESVQDRAESESWMKCFDIRQSIASLFDSELAIH